MLEVRDLKKYYKTKGGVEVHALDGVSIQFPETGMVFLLGKSGSGKSTLLNVSGGLDRPDSGEIIVKGKSSKDFTQSDFDSYRNTFVGFVFQEYNILNEFNIETNIALALELQGKKNDKKEVEDLLKKVDLEGMGKRKPNTLSGGQKQRIAIARALIKNPEIIMADEPTGALDSNTGKQVLDTLKKLSETKLVIIVSHDRDFAEEYADRIIELKDGKILSDHTKSFAQAELLSSNIKKVGDGTIQIKDGASLTEEDFKEVLKSIKGRGEIIISNNENNVTTFKKIAKISDDGAQQCFKDTDLKKIDIKSYDGKETKFIKSKLPARHALKMGASNLKIKPGRLIFTMFLCIVAFTMFGVLSTLMLYNPGFSQAKGLQEEVYESLVLKKMYNVHTTEYRTDKNGKEEVRDERIDDRDTNISKEDIAKLNNESLGLDFAGIYDKQFDLTQFLNIQSDYDFYKNSCLRGLSDCGEDYLLRQNGFSNIAGHYPIDDNEMAISEYTYEIFKECNYRDYDTGVTVEINNPNDLINKKVRAYLNNQMTGASKTFEFKISGIYKLDNALNNAKFDILKEKDRTSVSDNEYNEVLNSFNDVYRSSYSSLGYISKSFFDHNKTYLMPTNSYNRMSISNETFYGLRLLDPYSYQSFNNADDKSSYYPVYDSDCMSALTVSSVNSYKDYFKFYDVNGNALASVPFLTLNEAYINVRASSFRNAISEMANCSTGQMNGRYDRNGELSWYEPYYGSYTFEEIFINYSTKEIKFKEEDGFERIDGNGIIIDDDMNPIAFADFGYANSDYSDAKLEPETGYDNQTLCWFNMDKEFIGTYNGSFKTINLTDLYYDPTTDTPYLEDQVKSIYELDGKTRYVLKSDNSVELNKISTYCFDNNGKVQTIKKDNTYLCKGLFVNPTTGALSFKKQAGSVLTDKYYKDTKGNIIIGELVTSAYSRVDENNNEIYSFHYDFSEIGFVNMNYDEAGKSIYYVESLPNAEVALHGLIKLITAAKDGYVLDNIKPSYPNLDIEEIASEPLTTTEIKAVIGALESYYVKNSFDGSIKYSSPYGITSKNGSSQGLNIAGFYIVDDMLNSYDEIMIADEWKDKALPNPYNGDYSWRYVEKTNYVIDSNAQYSYLISLSDKTSEQLKYMLQEFPDESFYKLDNKVSETIDFVTGFLGELKLVFLIIGSSMAVFSALMLLNLISTSISSKQKEIGILRAVGARGSDVFKIFFSESGIIALICFAISSVLSGVTCVILNNKLAENENAFRLQLFEFGVINVAIVLGVAIVVSIIGTLLPVIKASRRPPVESIRAL
ncbi:MAG: ATP-binding cassette domain-containing protein [Bacilli bacterium]|nr:ATP-binding cassette domain-containing protein [Bacilli bacterium]